jgi:hypothetical protein
VVSVRSDAFTHRYLALRAAAPRRPRHSYDNFLSRSEYAGVEIRVIRGMLVRTSNSLQRPEIASGSSPAVLLRRPCYHLFLRLRCHSDEQRLVEEVLRVNVCCLRVDET